MLSGDSAGGTLTIVTAMSLRDKPADVPVIVQASAEQDYKLAPAALDAAITPRTKWVILNSPSNPTGAAYTADELRALENEADRLMLELYRDIYSGKLDPLQMFLLKEFFEILEKAIDRCQEAGAVVYQIVLKNS